MAGVFSEVRMVFVEVVPGGSIRGYRRCICV
jgi:hypothetical protein